MTLVVDFSRLKAFKVQSIRNQFQEKVGRVIDGMQLLCEVK